MEENSLLVQISIKNKDNIYFVEIEEEDIFIIMS